MKISIIIITLNEEYNLKRTLDSVILLNINNIKSLELVTEILIIDSGSNDLTEEIAKRYTDKFYFNQWKGYADQKNFGLSKATGDWILFLDADEVLTPELVNEIKSVCLEDNFLNAYDIKRKTFYLGKLLNYSWYPDIKTRLVSRISCPIWKGDFVHETLDFADVGKINYITFENHLIHYSYKNIENHFEKTLNYAKLSALDYFNRRKKFSYLNLIINPIYAFLRLYIIRKGFLDGFAGFVAGFSTFYYTFMKYVLLKEIEKNKQI